MQYLFNRIFEPKKDAFIYVFEEQHLSKMRARGTMKAVANNIR